MSSCRTLADLYNDMAHVWTEPSGEPGAIVTRSSGKILKAFQNTSLIRTSCLTGVLINGVLKILLKVVVCFVSVSMYGHCI